MYPRRAIKASLVLFAAIAFGQPEVQKPAQTSASGRSPDLTIQGVGRGIVLIDGVWQFHLGDDPSWAQPSLDDSGWESILTDDTWGDQGHPSYTGFAWYRRHLKILPTFGDSGNYSVFIPETQDAYEMYWNGKLIGQYGCLPPHASWYYNFRAFPKSIPLTGASEGVLAIRVWKAPLDAFDRADGGGVWLPQIGDPNTISLRAESSEWHIISADLFDYGLVLVRAFIAFMCLVLWYRDREQLLFVWVSIYTAAPVAIDILRPASSAFPFHGISPARSISRSMCSTTSPCGSCWSGCCGFTKISFWSVGQGRLHMRPWRPASPTDSWHSFGPMQLSGCNGQTDS